MGATSRRAVIKARAVTAQRRRDAATPGMVKNQGQWVHWEEVAEMLRSIRASLAHGEPEVVVAARQAGESWSAIGLALGVNPEVLRRRYVGDASADG